MQIRLVLHDSMHISDQFRPSRLVFLYNIRYTKLNDNNYNIIIDNTASVSFPEMSGKFPQIAVKVLI